MKSLSLPLHVLRNRTLWSSGSEGGIQRPTAPRRKSFKRTGVSGFEAAIWSSR